MNRQLSRWALALLGTGLLACSSTISSEKYVEVMSDLGCKRLMEGSEQAKALYKEHAVTDAQIMKFRQKTQAEKMGELATQIAEKVLACNMADAGQAMQKAAEAAGTAVQQAVDAAAAGAAQAGQAVPTTDQAPTTEGTNQ